MAEILSGHYIIRLSSVSGYNKRRKGRKEGGKVLILLTTAKGEFSSVVSLYQGLTNREVSFTPPITFTFENFSPL